MTTPLQPDVCSPWPTELCCDVTDVDPDLVTRMTAVASQILFRLSGRRWGPSCPVTVRPCRKTCLDEWPRSWFSWNSGSPWIPYMGEDGLWRNASVCGCSGDCSCGELCELYLPGPVYDVVSVQEGAVTLPAEAYRVDGSGTLLRTDGGCWETCQDLAADVGEENTLAVTYRTGLQLDESAIMAVSELVCHLLKSCGGSSCGCKIGRNVTNLTRQGVTMDMADPTTLFEEGRTGLPITDMWLMATNPYRMTSASRVYSPDFKRPRIQRTP
ncbi:hypothetical protein ACFY0N_00345 [Streptomyces vinaceus]|uniref:hypothetical protein n=1 Tax=Streptomyces vinaceus TaxID=1960 RepID=UPI0036AC1160